MYKKRTCRSFFCFIENTVFYKANHSVGSRCGGMELCRCCDLPQALYYLLERLQMFIFSASAISSSRKSG